MTQASARSRRAFSAPFLALLLLLSGTLSLFGYALHGYTWPAGTQIRMHLRLFNGPGALQDGSASWNDSAADALNIWNQYIDIVKFVADSPSGTSGENGENEAFFSSSVYGEAWPTGTLAVTLNMSSEGSSFTETDVLFNSSLKWNSYRGPLQGSGPSGTWDLHRVALHEFGHVLGLDHPDQHGQSVAAIMNSILSDLDHVTDDDIAGARSLYALKITSSLSPTVRSGDDFSYQITANRTSTSYAAVGLPPGFQLNTATGLISGRCATSGTFDVDVTAQTDLAPVMARVRILVSPRSITSSSFVQINLGDNFSYQIAADNSPTSFEATGLPVGVQLDGATGALNGKPQAAGTYTIKLIARSAQSEAAGNLTLVVQPPRITSSLNPPGIAVGNQFQYQITASSTSTAYEATGLPPGLELNMSTGQITGVATISGTYHVTIVAHGPYGDATASLTLTVPANPLPRAFDSPSFTLPVGAGPIVTDAARSRVYVVNGTSIAVINTAQPQVIATIPVSGVNYVPGLTISRDGKVLWFVRSGAIGRLDLETLQLLQDLPTNTLINDLREGLNNRLYAATSNGVVQLDAVTGAVQGTLDTGNCSIEISPDGTTLYVSKSFEKPKIQTYDVSSPSPVALKNNQPQGSNCVMSLSPDGTRLSLWTGPAITLYDTADIEHPLGLLPSPFYGFNAALFSRNNSLVFQLTNPAPDDPQIWAYDSATRQVVRRIKLPARSSGYRYLGVDGSNKYVMACPNPGAAGPALLFYPIVPQSATAPAHSLLNVSTRMRSQGGDNALIGGFIITGQEPKNIVLRAMGPSLPVAGKLADPILQLFDGTGTLVAQNDNWNSHRADVIATGIPPSDEHEAVIAATLPPGSYSAVVRGVNDTAGVALIEAYDLSTPSNSKLANISTRGKVEAGDNVMIGGFILGGGDATSVVVRAIGPSLANFGVGGALADPSLEVYDGNGSLLARDDDWRMYQEQQLAQTGLAPTDDRESALLLSLQPGAYTAIVRGKDNTAGVGLVEVYNLDAN